MRSSLVEGAPLRSASAFRTALGERLQGHAATADTERMDSEYYAGPVQHRAFAPDTAEGGGPAAQGLPPANPERPGRFARTEVSFGLTGRIVLTILLLIPLAGFIYLATHYFIGIGGIVVYGGVVVPWALRDLWRHPSHR
jgi:hypothetical protein